MHPFLPAFGSGRSRYVRVDELARARIIVLQVDLSDAALLKRSFAGEVHGPRVTFELRGIDPPFYYYFEHIETETDVLEQVSPADVFEAVGHVEGTVSQAVISGTLKGILALVSNLPVRTLDAYLPWRSLLRDGEALANHGIAAENRRLGHGHPAVRCWRCCRRCHWYWPARARSTNQGRFATCSS